MTIVVVFAFVRRQPGGARERNREGPMGKCEGRKSLAEMHEETYRRLKQQYDELQGRWMAGAMGRFGIKAWWVLPGLGPSPLHLPRAEVAGYFPTGRRSCRCVLDSAFGTLKSRPAWRPQAWPSCKCP